MLCGSGCQGAHDEVLGLADRLKAPIVHAFRGKEHVEWDNPFDVGASTWADSAFRQAITPCWIAGQAYLMLGTDFPYRQFYPRGAGVRISCR